MQRNLFNWLVALSLLAPLGAWGCGGAPETISERKKRSEAEMPAGQLPEDGAAAEGAVEEADTVMEDLGAAEVAEKPSGAAKRAAKKTVSERPKSSKKARAARAAATDLSDAGAGAAADEGDDRGGGREDSVLGELRKDKTLRQEEALYHAKKGDGFYAQSNYEEARKAYDRALTLDPSLDQVRERWNNAKLILGERSGEIPAVSNEVINSRRVSEEQALIEIDRKVSEGKAALDAMDVEKAERLLSQAVDEIHLQSDFDDAKRREANDLLREIRTKREDIKRQREQALGDETQKQALQELDNAARVRQAQVQELLRKSAEFLRQHDYEKAIEACERILKIEPDNRVAKFWLSDARDQVVQERRLTLIKNRLENNKLKNEEFEKAISPQDKEFEFPSDREWAIAQAREKNLNVVATEDPEPIRRIKNALADKVDFSFDKTPLNDVVQQLRTVTGAKIGIDPAVDGATVAVSGNYQGLPAMNVLNLILESVGLTYIFKENILFITNPGQKAGNVEFGIYNVSDILNKVRDFTGPELILRPTGESGESPISFTTEVTDEESQLDPDKLGALIKESTGGEDAWGEPNSIEFHSGQFLVNASRELHGKIQTVLENLRKDSDLFVVIEARFIDVNDDFLEDIGIDSRALGLANNYGTPFGNVINDGRTGGQDLGFVKQGSPVRDVTLIMGQDRWAGRVRHIIDGFTGTIRGDRLNAGSGISGFTLQTTFLEPFQINTILRAVQERLDVRQLTAPVVTAHNGQRVFVSVITQRAYIADYNLVSGGTGFAIIEVADPEVQTFQEGVILDVDPVVSHDKKYVTLDVRPTLATLIGGVISTILISLGSFTNVAFMVPIGIPEISLQQSFTSVTVPNGGTVLLGGFKALNETKLKSYLPILGNIPILGNLFRRKSQIVEKRSLVILLSVRIVDLRGSEAKTYNAE